MDEKTLEQSLADEFIREWDITPTGNGYLITTDWQWPNHERIEIFVRMVGDREDLLLVTDGGELFSFLYSQGIDLSKDEHGMKVINGVAEHYGAKIADFQMARGTNPGDLPRSIRLLLEAIKDASLLLWYKLDQRSSLH
ncbi:hypothetical protein [Desulforhabdus amnigena]|jgi:hypothetical protein|uniref:DUF1828 domain-containing protein n=1 Tax=Desulforhabdus amnigena TaxID=40218 RepID=A0A9W6D206_9BACT|nr:hypothetical protein [Desulforhabdus amnigena]NLJ28823.1 hypothetical protein [Deltaproteobacteria bacterium]GLI33158.1 hypothetical protein DAMNIGENAA_05910 [Desulforhabdus amnigena]